MRGGAHEVTELKLQLCQVFSVLRSVLVQIFSVFFENSTVVMPWHHCELFIAYRKLNVLVKVNYSMVCPAPFAATRSILSHLAKGID